MYAEPYAADPNFAHTHMAPPVAAAPYAPTYVPTYEPSRAGGSRFKGMNCCALLCALIIFAVLIAASTVCWYHNNENWDATTTAATGTTTFRVNSTESCYDLEGVSTTFSSSGAHAATFTEYNSSSSTWSIMKLIQSFVLIGLILAGILAILLVICFADGVRNRLLFMLGMNVIRIILLLIAVMILISLVISFLAFLGITNAFSDDVPACNSGYCRRFSDTVKEDRGTGTVINNGNNVVATLQREQNFGPDAGWFLVLALIPIAIILCIVIVLNKFPIPVDSVGSGEAL